MFFWSVHFAASLLTTVLLLYHANLVLNGKTTHENNARKNSYNLGWRQNLKEVMLKTLLFLRNCCLAYLLLY